MQNEFYHRVIIHNICYEKLYLRRISREIIKQSGVKERPLYNLRHTFVSQMINQEADIVWVSNMLEHKNVSITLSTYTKLANIGCEAKFP
ncbi:hypothetical protein CJ673_05640 [Aliarcobacter cryaerophilus]|uniref:Tyr recombinase domain-containing protein n=1 Tax=Aliarcobacter cryaerophilus TaxID=28198 RepID=A0A2S9T872_9BACT|nr:tyrosine-type recombinase/integrase [Aliarcobacter cryaerophilus]PRM95037.1 hypothetical protein CJ673_05640 [Aliarcobacter cryaerophilus]